MFGETQDGGLVTAGDAANGRCRRVIFAGRIDRGYSQNRQWALEPEDTMSVGGKMETSPDMFHVSR